MHVPFNDLKRHVASMRGPIDTAVASVLESGWFLAGPQLDGFEADFARYCGVEHCVGVGNGTDALEIALRAVGCGPGDEVVTVANAGMYTTAACILVGATPVYVDVDPGTLEMDVAQVEGLLSSLTRAIVVTHLYGKLADVEGALQIGLNRGVAVIEDCAQAHGAEKYGKRAGSFGDLATFSFYPTKNLGALGDGGAVVTTRDDVAEQLRALRQYGWRSKYEAVVPHGRNSRLDEIQAAILCVKLKRLDEWNDRRRQIATAYRDAARGTRLHIAHEAASDFVAHLCVGLHPERDAFRRRLAAAGVDTAVHYPTPDHKQPALSAVAWRAGTLEVTEAAVRDVVSLPCFPEMTDAEVEYVCSAIGDEV